ncbi:MAG: 3-deoxy-D-manno-octulosonic acid transferase [Candidatus Omnitrophica bacterium]|nr:3-deoxy-D-manno-octulosonic acid transferase [Candidatus Omnitrophota bacterium]
MFFIYDILLLILILLYLPFAIFKGKFRRDFILRLSRLPSGVKFDRPIWLHAVSVGEVVSAQPLLEKLRQAYPGRQIIISTITATGNKVARGLAGGKEFVFYLPLYFSFMMRGLINRIDPAVCIIMETELWPNLITCLHKKGVPIILVNARVSDASYGKYKFAKFFFEPILKKIDIFCAQSQADAARFVSLGALEAKVKITGNMKFDIAAKELGEQRSDLFFSARDRLFVAGSTHRGEEEIILSAFKKLSTEFPDLKLLLAPRHPERAADVAGLVASYGFNPVFMSRNEGLQEKPIFILDSVGRLASLYAQASVVFVGGSLVKKGGHNVIEPAYFKKAIIIGPYMHNFKDITGCFLKMNALVMVRNKDELEVALRSLLKDDARRAGLGESAFQVIRAQQGASARDLEQINILLKK